MTTIKDLTGQKFGQLVVLRRGGGMYGRPSWVCKCSCGSITEVGRGNLRNGSTTSCGCVRDSLLSSKSTSHGLSHTRAYSSWKKMLARCYDRKHPYYHKYGGAGVTVCSRWRKSIENFFADMGECPLGYTLDRINNVEGYSKKNCRWATVQEQANNRSSNVMHKFRGCMLTTAEVAREVGIPYATLRKRLDRMSLTKAVNLPRYARG